MLKPCSINDCSIGFLTNLIFTILTSEKVFKYILLIFLTSIIIQHLQGLTMKRRIVKQGHNTHTNTLPSTWVRLNNLKSGQELEVVEQDNRLIVTTEPSSEYKTAIFDITGATISTIWKYYMAIYRQGYDEVKITYDPTHTLPNPYSYYRRQTYDSRFAKYNQTKTIEEAVRLFTNRFVGFEIVEHGVNYTLIKSIGDVSLKEFDNSLRRVFLLLQSMAHNIIDFLKTKDRRKIETIYDTDTNLDKFHDYCVRVINKYRVTLPQHTTPTIGILQFIELVGDEYKNITNHLLFDIHSKQYKGLLWIAELIAQAIDHYVDIYYKFSNDKVHILAKLDDKIYTSIAKFIKKAPFSEQEILHHFRIIRRYLNSLLELRIQKEF